MQKAYRIKGWNDLYENSESRKIQSKSIKFVIVPNKQDGKGYGRISQEKDGILIFGVWNLILQVASKMPERGLLVDEDGPLNFSDLEFMTRYPAKLFEKAINYLSSSKIGWIEIIDCPEKITLSGRNPVDIPINPGGILKNPVEGNRIEGKEGKGNPMSDCPYRQIVTEYNQICKSLPNVQKLTKTRKQHIKARWSDYGDINSFIKVFKNAEKSDFLSGRCGNWQNCNFDSLMTPKIFTKCIEGGYDNKAAVDDTRLTKRSEQAVKTLPEPLNWKQLLPKLYPDSSFRGTWQMLCFSNPSVAQTIIDFIDK